MKKYINYLLEYLFKIFLLSVKIFPYKIKEKIICFLVFNLCKIFNIRYKLVKKQLEMVFVQKNNLEIKQLIKNIYYNLAKMFCEFCFLNIDKLDEKITFKGKENLQKALNSGKGIVLTSAHIGNWEIAMVYMAKIGIKINGLVKRIKNPYFDDFINNLRRKNGAKIIYSENALKGTLKALKNKEMVCFLMDQNARDNGYQMPFLNKTASVFSGGVKLAMKAKAVILPAYAIRDQKGNFIFYFETPIFCDEYSDDEEGIYKILQKVNLSIENIVLKYPEQWFWVHKRWKGSSKAKKFI